MSAPPQPGSSADDHELNDFWEASALNHLTITDFASRVLAYDPETAVIDPLAGNEAGWALPLKRDRLQKSFESRRSSRSFGPQSLSTKALGQVLGAVQGLPPTTDGPQRVYPSAGGLGAVEVFALLHNVESPLGRRAARYLPGGHQLAPLPADLPPFAEIDELCSLEGNEPALVLIFAIQIDELLAKYGPRGARFALIEVGHACQNIALRLSADGLVGYQLGGVLDHNLEQLLDIGAGRALVTLGYAIGHPD